MPGPTRERIVTIRRSGGGTPQSRYWLAHPPEGEYIVLSNYSDLVAFASQRACLPSPRKKSGPYGTVEYPVAEYATELFSAGQEVYLIWIEPNAHDYFYSPEDTAPHREAEDSVHRQRWKRISPEAKDGHIVASENV